MLEAELQTYGYLAIFVLAVVEGEAALVSAAWLAHRGEMPYWEGLVAAFAGSWLTGEVLFFSTLYGRGWVARKAAANPRVARIEDWVRGRGRLLVFFSRFLWGFRPWIPPACALCGMNWKTFTAFNFVGTLFWIAFFSPICWYFGQAIQAALESSIAARDLVLVAIGIGLIVAAGRWARRRFATARP
ncbi:MAG: DedA family protein [Bryobacterales bacterium]|nr:DedA family protein [Bryobacterales bacterium]